MLVFRELSRDSPRGPGCREPDYGSAARVGSVSVSSGTRQAGGPGCLFSMLLEHLNIV